MSILACLRGKGAAGLAPKEAADALAAALEARMEARAELIGRAAAEREAADGMLTGAEAAVERAVLLRADTIAAQISMTRRVAEYRTIIQERRATPGYFGLGNKAPPGLGKDWHDVTGPALRAIMTRDPWEIGSGDNVFYLARNIRGEAHRLMGEHVGYLHSRNVGLTDETVREADLLKALYGAADAPAEARAIAEAWSQKVAPFLMREHNAVSRGGIAERRDWRLPNPVHDRAKLAAVSVETYIDRTLPRLDRDQMLDYTTGRPLDDAALRQVLETVYRSVTTDGLDGPATPVAGRTILANGRADHRVLAFRTADDWLGHAGDFGEHAGVFSTMTGHIEGMARDIALMRMLGPNPEATKAYALALFDRAGTAAMTEASLPGATVAAVKQNRKAVAVIKADRKGFENLYAQVSGAANIPVHDGMAKAMGDWRAWLVSTQMGSAIISSISDMGLLPMVARFNDIPAGRVIARYVRGMASGEMEITAAQAGFVADSFIHAHGGVDRIMGEEIRSGWAARLSNAVIRASGLRRHSAVLRAAFGLEYQAAVARDLRLDWAALSERRRAAFGRVGITEQDWRVIRDAEPWMPRDDAPFLRSADIRALAAPEARRIADAYQRLLDTEMDYAVIESGDPLTRAFLYGDSRPGEGIGEMRRGLGLYKSFPITFINTHFARAAAQGWDGSRLGHAGLTFIAMTALGAVAMQAKEIAKGRDPLSLDPADRKGQLAWGRAILQGGGLGVFGDILGADKTRLGNSWAAMLAGPQAAMIEQVFGVTFSRNVTRALKGEDTHFAGDALYTAGGLMPGSSLWFARLAFERGVMDQLALMIDPRTPQRFRRIEAEAQRTWGQDTWWARGQTAPERAPDLTRMLEPQS